MERAIELTVIRDLYKEVYEADDEGNERVDVILVKKGFKTPWLVRDVENISDIEPDFNENGRKYPNRTRVRFNGEVRTVMMSYKELKTLLAHPTDNNQVGFNYGTTHTTRTSTGFRSRFAGDTGNEKNLGT